MDEDAWKNQQSHSFSFHIANPSTRDIKTIRRMECVQLQFKIDQFDEDEPNLDLYLHGYVRYNEMKTHSEVMDLLPRRACVCRTSVDCNFTIFDDIDYERGLPPTYEECQLVGA